MASAIEKAIHGAFEELWGDGSPDEPLPAPASRDPLYWKALAVGPDQDDDALDLLQRHLALQADVDDFRASIDDLITKHAGDERYAARCRKALQARSDLIGLQQRMLLTDWWPTLRHTCLPT